MSATDTPREKFNVGSLLRWGEALEKEGNSIGHSLVQYAKSWASEVESTRCSPAQQAEFDRDTDGELLMDWSPSKGRMVTLSLRADGRLSYAVSWDGESFHGTADMPVADSSAAPAPREQKSDDCWCRACHVGDVMWGATNFVVCPSCGCKRCPHADNHVAPCSGETGHDVPGGHTCTGCEEVQAQWAERETAQEAVARVSNSHPNCIEWLSARDAVSLPVGTLLYTRPMSDKGGA